MRRRRRKAIDFRLEVAPVNLIDLLLVMLIFFVTTTTFLQLRMIELSLPPSSSKVLQPGDERMHVLNIDQECGLSLDARPIDKEELGSALRTLRKQSPKAQFHLGAEEESPHRCFVKVLELLQEEQVKDIAILTRPRR